MVKIGGSLLRSAFDLERAAALVARRRREGESILVVVSALWGVTDQLDRLACLAADPSTNGACGRAVEKLRRQHQAVAQWIGGGSQSALLVAAIRALLADVTARVDGIHRCGELPEWTYTRLLSSGERLAAPLLAAAIRCAGADARAITAEDLDLRARGPARNGACDLAGSAAGFRAIRPELRRRVLVLTGFYGLASAGRVVLFGRGGSDDTASAAAACLAAETLELWKDVPGCMSSDPKIIAGARPVPELSFNEAETLGGYGCPLVHSTCLEVLRNRPIRVEIGLPEGLGGRRTRLVRQRSGPAGVTVLVAHHEPPRVAAVGEGIVSAPALVEQMRESLVRSQIRGPLTPRFAGTAGVSFDVDSDECVAALTCLHDTFFPPVTNRRTNRMKRLHGRAAPLLVLLAAAMLLSAAAEPPQNRSVSVLYAGSLATVMENGVGPAFSKATGIAYKGEGHGSLGAARLIHDRLRSPDVFLSADPAVNESVLMGSRNGNLVTWFATFASSQLVLAYNPKSRFAADFAAAAAGKTPWYEVLGKPGVRFGRGDPAIDPKGYRTLFLFNLAGKHYRRPEIPRLLGDALNPAQVLPEVSLLARVESGQFDAGIFYKHEIVAYKLPFVSFPAEIDLSDSRFAGFYAQATYTTPNGERVSGAPILFTITIPKTVQDQAAAKAFVRFLLSSPELLKRFGFGIDEHRVGGDRAQVPADLRGLCAGAYKP